MRQGYQLAKQRWRGKEYHPGTIDNRIVGFQGELAMGHHLAARRLGGPGEPDLKLPGGTCVDVRTRRGLERDLLVLPQDPPRRAILLVVGEWPKLEGPSKAPPTCLWWVGWIYAGAAREVGRWAEELPTPCWLVAQSALHTPAAFWEEFGKKKKGP